jgi:multiple sugar transport system ATP-binding protein
MFISNYPDSVIEATVRVYELLGAEVSCTSQLMRILKLQHELILVQQQDRYDTLKIAFDMSKLHVFDKETEKVITN